MSAAIEVDPFEARPLEDDEPFTDTSSVWSDEDEEGDEATLDDGIQDALGALDSKQKGDVLRYAKRLVKARKSCQAAFRRIEKPTKQTLLDLLPPPFYDQYWTVQDEGDLQQKLGTDQYCAYLRRIGLPNNLSFLPMWKKIPAFVKYLPTDVICAETHLVYAATPKVNIGNGEMRADPQWTAKFCTRLTRLALGGPCEENPKLLSLFLRYAVACRINGRRPIPFDYGRINDRFLQELKDRMSKTDGTKSVARIHQEVRRDLRATGSKIPWYSDMLRQLEKLLYRASTDPNHGPCGARWENFAPYKLTTTDLNYVERAFNHCLQHGVPRFNVGDKYKQLSRSQKFDYPKTATDLRDIRLAAYSAERRFIARRQRLLEGPDDSANERTLSPRTSVNHGAEDQEMRLYDPPGAPQDDGKMDGTDFAPFPPTPPPPPPPPHPPAPHFSPPPPAPPPPHSSPPHQLLSEDADEGDQHLTRQPARSDQPSEEELPPCVFPEEDDEVLQGPFRGQVQNLPEKDGNFEKALRNLTVPRAVHHGQRRHTSLLADVEQLETVLDEEHRILSGYEAYDTWAKKPLRKF